MSFYDLPDKQVTKMSVDYDFYACLEYNPQPFNFTDVDKVLAVIEGENDVKDWHWVVKLKDKREAYLRGGCDYTGWDCQSGASTIFLGAETSLLAAIDALREDWQDDDPQEILRTLQNQLDSHKATTWREKKDKEFGLRV